ncbi:DUF2332 domain-containing protein [Sinorhizobium americanum]|uniref:Uncharacterized protein n=1 Tax=Sinorhizobium americanum TaxID=194963 RepID=A0A1L3LR43_9HYPH|nr:DUF2332 family protein [Sinorhizobium americanum]APG92537.1 hypothetical protein SAMCFNEI73_Ch3275 [Sinorhizobium americanum]OAP35403.1 hypothetical protein ATC00_11460 [Sinorhizobium americanum]
MPDAGPADSVRSAFRDQAKACEQLGSPFTARLCRLAAEHLNEKTAVGRRVLTWPGDPSANVDALALRLFGSLHALVLLNRDEVLAGCYSPNHTDDAMLWAACEGALARHADFILQRLRSAPQTNEVRRSGALLPGFLTITGLLRKGLVLSEIGASAGLNLYWDRYRYAHPDGAWGDETADVVIAPEWRGETPKLGSVEIVERAGCDLNPLNPADEDDRLRLLSYIWADQLDRLDRTRKALDIAASEGRPVERADAIDWLKVRLALRFPGAVHVIYHSIAWQYLPATAQREGEAPISAAGAAATGEAPLARLQMEGDGQTPGAALSLQIWPGGEKHLIGRADYHGRWVTWQGWPASA